MMREPFLLFALRPSAALQLGNQREKHKPLGTPAALNMHMHTRYTRCRDKGGSNHPICHGGMGRTKGKEGTSLHSRGHKVGAQSTWHCSKELEYCNGHQLKGYKTYGIF